MSGDFYEDDEDLEEVVAAFCQGEPGITEGSGDIGQVATAIVEAAVEKLTTSSPPTIQMPFLAGAVEPEPWATTSSTHETTTGKLINA